MFHDYIFNVYIYIEKNAKKIFIIDNDKLLNDLIQQQVLTVLRRILT